MGDPDQSPPLCGRQQCGRSWPSRCWELGRSRANVSLPLSAQAVSYRQVIDWISEATGRSITIESVPTWNRATRSARQLFSSCGPGWPPATIEPIETVEVAVKFGLSL